MNVNSVGIGTGDVNKVNQVKQEKQEIQKAELQRFKQSQTTTNQTDKLEISNEAKKMQTIENRLKNRFYDNKEVQRKTALNIYRKIFAG